MILIIIDKNVYTLLHRLNNIVNKMMPYLEIPRFVFRFMFANFFFNAFSFINNRFHIRSVKKLFLTLYI